MPNLGDQKVLAGAQREWAHRVEGRAGADVEGIAGAGGGGLTGRYVATGPEAEFEPGSRGRVLRNLLGITRVRDMNEAESQALVLAQESALDRFGPEHRFTAEDICALHRLWLGPIYGWAGEYRSVNIGKAGFQFAHAPLIPGLMADCSAAHWLA
jgi:fido (protein-threonine AMPylation protein)